MKKSLPRVEVLSNIEILCSAASIAKEFRSWQTQALLPLLDFSSHGMRSMPGKLTKMMLRRIVHGRKTALIIYDGHLNKEIIFDDFHI